MALGLASRAAGVAAAAALPFVIAGTAALAADLDRSRPRWRYVATTALVGGAALWLSAVFLVLGGIWTVCALRAYEDEHPRPFAASCGVALLATCVVALILAVSVLPAALANARHGTAIPLSAERVATSCGLVAATLAAALILAGRPPPPEEAIRVQGKLTPIDSRAGNRLRLLRAALDAPDPFARPAPPSSSDAPPPPG